MKVAPLPGLLSTVAAPPCAVTIRLTSQRPRPMPGWLSESVARSNCPKIRSWSSVAIPGPSSRTVRRTLPELPELTETVMRRAASVLDRVPHQVRDHLVKPAAVPPTRRGPVTASSTRPPASAAASS